MHSDDEKLAAAIELCRFSPVIPQELLKRYSGSWESLLIDKQCALTRRDNQLAKAKELFQNMSLLMALCSDSATPTAKAYALGWQREVNEFLEAK